VILEGLTEAEVGLIEGLDGGKDRHDLYAAACHAGISSERVTSLLEVLRARCLLLESPTDRAALAHLGDPWRELLGPDAAALAAAYGLDGDGYSHLMARRRQHVVVSGCGGLPTAVAALLRAGGVGLVELGETAADSLDLDLRHDRHGELPDLVVLAAAGAVRSETGEPWRRRGIPHLPVVTQGHRVMIGPLVLPARSSARHPASPAGPCLRCLDLHRADRDAAWPVLLSQLAPPHRVGDTGPVEAPTTLTALGAGLAAMVVHACLDGQPVPGDLSLEVAMPWPRVDSRRWTLHPRCPCNEAQGTMTW